MTNQPISQLLRRLWGQFYSRRSVQFGYLLALMGLLTSTDSTIGENIALGVAKDKIDYQRIRQSAQQAQLSDSIESWPNQYQTLVGERGICLSGGQRQRIGIARALL